MRLSSKLSNVRRMPEEGPQVFLPTAPGRAGRQAGLGRNEKVDSFRAWKWGHLGDSGRQAGWQGGGGGMVRMNWEGHQIPPLPHDA